MKDVVTLRRFIYIIAKENGIEQLPFCSLRPLPCTRSELEWDFPGKWKARTLILQGNKKCCGAFQCSSRGTSWHLILWKSLICPPTKASTATYHSKLPLPMRRVHLKSCAHHLCRFETCWRSNCSSIHCILLHFGAKSFYMISHCALCMIGAQFWKRNSCSVRMEFAALLSSSVSFRKAFARCWSPSGADVRPNFHCGFRHALLRNCFMFSALFLPSLSCHKPRNSADPSSFCHCL